MDKCSVKTWTMYIRCSPLPETILFNKCPTYFQSLNHCISLPPPAQKYTTYLPISVAKRECSFSFIFLCLVYTQAEPVNIYTKSIKHVCEATAAPVPRWQSSSGAVPVLLSLSVVEWANFTNPTMHLFHIPQCTIQNRNMHISVLNGALWDIEQVQCRIGELG